MSNGIETTYQLEQNFTESGDFLRYEVDITAKAASRRLDPRVIFCRGCPLAGETYSRVCSGLRPKAPGGLVFEARFHAPSAALDPLLKVAKCLEVK